MSSSEVLPPRPPRTTANSIDADEPPEVRGRTSRPANKAKKRSKTTLERLREQAAALDAALDRSYQRFCQDEITAREMDRKRDQLVGSFNQRVMSDIRYRSMLRRRSDGAR